MTAPNVASGEMGALPATGFGVGTLVVAIIGGIFTFGGWLVHRFGRAKD